MPNMILEQLKRQVNDLRDYRDAAASMAAISEFWDAEYHRAAKVVEEMEQEIAQMEAQE